MPNHERESAVATQARFHTYSLASYTLERCEKVVFHDPTMARELARLGRSVAEQADPRECGGTAALADLEAYAMAMESNAARVGGDLHEAFSMILLSRRAARRTGEERFPTSPPASISWRPRCAATCASSPRPSSSSTGRSGASSPSTTATCRHG